HAAGAGAVTLFYFHLCDVRSQEPSRRGLASASARYPAIGTDLGLHLGDSRVLYVAGTRTRAGRGIRGHFRDFHQPGLEYGVQLLSVAAHGARRAGGSFAHVSALALDVFLARGSAIRDATTDLEYDGVHVGQLVLC